MLRLLIVVLVSTAASAQTIYRWVDRNGEPHYTDDASKIPKGVRVETTDGVPLTVMPATTPEPPRREPTPAPARREPRPPEQANAGPVTVTLREVPPDITPEDRAYVEQSLATAAASPRLKTWGGLRTSVTVGVIDKRTLPAGPSCGGDGWFGLAQGTGRVWLSAPGSTTTRGGYALPYERTALHELGHIIEHQWAGERQRPRWFAEGFASYVADFDGYAGQVMVAHWVVKEGGDQPLDRVFGAGNVHLAYSTATLAVRFFVARWGDDGLNRLFALRKQGLEFDAAFERVTGKTVPEFQRLFVEHLAAQL